MQMTFPSWRIALRPGRGFVGVLSGVEGIALRRFGGLVDSEGSYPKSGCFRGALRVAMVERLREVDGVDILAISVDRGGVRGRFATRLPGLLSGL